ncbi:MAG: rhomboid family intramembrane serine protease [Actinomycetota bacterium]|nr:rhomboid family intramembrane serine protease [Actinomycetota bacterium]
MTTAAESPRSERRAGFQLVLGMAAVMWVLEIVDRTVGSDLDDYGIQPREPDGLVGIVTSPFLHGGMDHLMSNTVPFLAMGLAIALAGAARVLAVTAIVMVVGGLGTWLIGPDNTNHIGASGVVFGYASYLLVRGFYNRNALELLMGLVVGVLWGSVLLSGLVPREGISWQGHLFGGIGGVVAARALATRPRPAERPG